MKNIALVFVGFLAVFLIAGALSALSVFLFGKVVGVAVAFPFIEIAIIVNELSAESYMKKMADEREARAVQFGADASGI